MKHKKKKSKELRQGLEKYFVHGPSHPHRVMTGDVASNHQPAWWWAQKLAEEHEEAARAYHMLIRQLKDACALLSIVEDWHFTRTKKVQTLAKIRVLLDNVKGN